MFRVTLAAYLLMVSFTGPTPCCCTAARSVAMVLSWTSLVASSGDQDVAPRSCCRRQLRGSSAAESDGPGKAPQPSPAGDPVRRCLCETSLCDAVRNSVPTLLVEGWHPAPDCLTLAFAESVFSKARQSTTAAVNSGGVIFAARSGREIRIAFRSWCC